MIHSATTSAKFKKLVRRLRPLLDSGMISVEVVATGLLERLWHIAIESAKRGDIGRFDNELIAEMVGWLGEPDDLIEILISTGWLDESAEYRLLIHDWNEHCPGFIKKNINRLGGFASDSSEDEKERLRENESSPEPFSEDITAQVSHSGSTPNITQHNPTKQNPTQPPAASDLVSSDSSSLDFKNDDVFWGSEPIGWIEFDWIACRQAFIARWKKLPGGESTGGVRASRFSDLPADLCGPFRDRWASREWREVCRDAFAKIAADGGLRNKSQLPLKRWLTEESLADSVVGGAYDFDPTGNSKPPPEKPALHLSETMKTYYRNKKAAENAATN